MFHPLPLLMHACLIRSCITITDMGLDFFMTSYCDTLVPDAIQTAACTLTSSTYMEWISLYAVNAYYITSLSVKTTQHNAPMLLLKKKG